MSNQDLGVVLEAAEHAQRESSALDKRRAEEKVMQDPRTSVTDFGVFCGILTHINGKTGRCFPGIALIAQTAKVSTKTVRRSMKALAETGHIHVVHGRRYHGSNHYIFTALGGLIQDIVSPPEDILSPREDTESPREGHSVPTRGHRVPLTRGEGNPRELTQENEHRENSLSALSASQERLLQNVFREKDRTWPDVQRAWLQIGSALEDPPDTMQEMAADDVNAVLKWARAGAGRDGNELGGLGERIDAKAWIARYGLPKSAAERKEAS